MMGTYRKIVKSSFVTVLALGLAGGIALAQPGAQTAVPHAMMMAQTAAQSGLININTATKADLSALPGIGAVYAQKIIDGRPYRSKGELTTRKILPTATYTRIRDRIIASRSATPPAPKK